MWHRKGHLARGSSKVQFKMLQDNPCYIVGQIYVQMNQTPTRFDCVIVEHVV